MDRTETARALAKAIAYANNGDLHTAAYWLRELVEQFASAGVTL